MWGQVVIKTKLGVNFKFLDKWNPKLANHGLPRFLPYLLTIFKMALWPIRGSSFSSPHSAAWSTSPISLSFPLNFLSPLSSLSRVLSLTISAPPLRRRCAHAARGGSPAVDEPVPEVLAEDELRWSSSWSSKVPPLVSFIVEFRRRSTSYHGETTCFGTSFQSSTKPYPSWWTNHHHWKASYYSYHAFHGFFRWTEVVSWGETPKNFMYSSS